jgi:diadenosine tetraphosphate (Ap4A) HIT family hydrolase
LPNLIETRVLLAREGRNPYVITHLKSGWLVIGDVQPLPGYCLLLADPVVESLNALGTADRIQYSLDTILAGDAVLAITGALRINYETLGNAEPALHTHIIPRFQSEPDLKRRKPPFSVYDWTTARKFDPLLDQPFVDKMRDLLRSHSH